MKTVFLDSASLDFGDLDLRQLNSVSGDLVCYKSTPSDLVLDRISSASIVISNKVPLNAQTLTNAPALKLICVAATGTNNVDLEAARTQNIVVSNCQAYGTASVVQHVFSLMLALSTRLLDYQNDIKAGKWQQATQFCLLDHPIMELKGKRLGIVGFGHLGQGVARIAEAFEMDILIAQRPGGPANAGRIPLAELLPQVDILTLHCPLTEDTHNLIGQAELALMKPTALLINAARGGIVNEEALADALRNKMLGGAGVDVLTEEPPRHGNPLLNSDLPNLIVTPHSAWGSMEARQTIVDQLTKNIEGFIQGQPMRVIK